MNHRGESTARRIVERSARTAVATLVSLLVARALRLPEAFWAPLTVVVITQSSLGAALSVSWSRLAGTALGATVGAVIASYFGPHALAFAIGVFVLGLLSAVVRTDQSVYRIAVIALAIVLLVPRSDPAWHVAFLRFATVSVAIGVALILAVVWPEREAAPTGKG